MPCLKQAIVKELTVFVCSGTKIQTCGTDGNHTPINSINHSLAIAVTIIMLHTKP